MSENNQLWDFYDGGGVLYKDRRTTGGALRVTITNVQIGGNTQPEDDDA